MLDRNPPGGQDRYFEQSDALQAGAGFDLARMAEVNRRQTTESAGGH